MLRLIARPLRLRKMVPLGAFVAGVLAFIFVAAACGGDTTSTPTSSPKPTAEQVATSTPEPTAERVATSTPEPTAEQVATSTPVSSDDQAATSKGTAAKALPDKIVAPHFIDSYPSHGDSLAQLAEVVLLNFNFNLHPNSAIRVTRGAEALSVDPPFISDDELSMATTLPAEGGDGIYKVDYDACWPDGSCHQGSVSFTVDSASISDYVDLRGQDAVTIDMKGERFGPARMIISPGTTVTWVNSDAVTHFVNSDPHPAHNVLAALNSSSLNPSDSYTYTFEDSGAWGYHCSAHFNVGMTAQVVVK